MNIKKTFKCIKSSAIVDSFYSMKDCYVNRIGDTYPPPRKRSIGVYRNDLVRLSDRLSVQNSGPVHIFIM